MDGWMQLRLDKALAQRERKKKKGCNLAQQMILNNTTSNTPFDVNTANQA